MQKARCSIILFLALALNPAMAKLGSTMHENNKQFGGEIITKQFSDGNKDFSGKKIYQLPFFGWQLEALYVNGKSFSEVARPKGGKVKKTILSEREANTIADTLYPKKERGAYKKRVKNANFISHFYENGLVSFEMQLDKRRKHHIGVIGVRTLFYNDKTTFNNIKLNAYH